MVDLIVICGSIVFAIITMVIGFQEVRMNYFNPLPKFLDSEKRIDSIKLFKTREIQG